MDDGEELDLPAYAFRDVLLAILSRGESARFRAAGQSMSPFILDGDLLTVAPVRQRSARTGDIIVFRRVANDKIRVHRVVMRLPDGYLVRGDAALRSDGLVPFDKVVGRVSKIERDGREVSRGTGPERRFVAALSRRGLLIPALARYRSVRMLLRKAR